jgi:ppGpp synthetase/RelA/SpoT-type nucleotidyltranferase
MPASDLTKAQINKAGDVMRLVALGQLDWIGDYAKVGPALDVMVMYRAAHQYPLTKATMGLRSMVRTEGARIEVSQRLKRITTMVDKLGRQATMRLSTMQDIGGCRAVLATIDELRRIEQRLKRNRPPIRYSDYITTPRSSGYRSVHVVIQYPDEEGIERAIEVQLRTMVMHEWAIAVERLSGRLNEDLKSGRGPEAVLVWLKAISEAMAIEEAGEHVPSYLIERILQLREAAVLYLGRSPR